MNRSWLWGPSSALALDTQRTLAFFWKKTLWGKPERSSKQRGSIYLKANNQTKDNKKEDGSREFGLRFPLCFLPSLHVFMHFLHLEPVLPPPVFLKCHNLSYIPCAHIVRAPWAPFQQGCAERWGAQLGFSKEAKEIFMENMVRIWHLALFCSFASPTLQEQSKQMYAPTLINPFGKISKKNLLGLETFEEREISCQPDAEIYFVPPCGPNHQSPPQLPFLLRAWRAPLHCWRKEFGEQEDSIIWVKFKQKITWQWKLLLYLKIPQWVRLLKTAKLRSKTIASSQQSAGFIH